MFVKRFVADDMQEAIRKINNELGPDAVILENRKVRRKGIAGLFRKKWIEVIAAYEPNRPKESAGESRDLQSAQAEAISKIDETLNDKQADRLGKQMRELKDAVQDISDRMRAAGRESAPTYSPEVLGVYDRLIKRGVQADICREIADQTQAIKERRNLDAVTVAGQLVSDRLGDPAPVKLKKFERNVLIFAGPTGAGKTTTLAKLAGMFKYREHLAVGLVNTDTYRVGAMEHIRIYADIMNVPLFMAYGADEVGNALKKLEDMDVVLIDTAGKNARDEDYRKELLRIIEAAGADEVLLVLSVVTGSGACREIIENYAFLSDYKLVITKLDEADVWGNALNIADYSKKGIAYLTVGQNVPDDICEADTRRLALDIVGDKEMCDD